jgi:CubicO group peptidase (beta-lactamase class C family)
MQVRIFGGALALLAGCLMGCFAIAAGAQTVRPEQVGLSTDRLERIGELMQASVDAGDISGAVTLVARNGQIAHLEAFGYSELETRKPMRTDSIFRIASMTKPITATAIMMLVEDGSLRLSDPVSRFIPAFADIEVGVARQQPGRGRGGAGGGFGGGAPPDFYTVPADRALTIVDVLTHTGGVMSGAIGNAGGNPIFNQRERLGLAWAEGLGDVALDFQPGSRWSYSGLGGFDVLARIVEIVSGQTFEEFLDQRVFGPLAMADTAFWADAGARERLVGNYSRGPNGLEPNADPDMLQSQRYFSGSGGLISTAEDYARFAMSLANGGEYRGTRLLSPASVHLMTSPVIPDTLPGRSRGEGYGLGGRVVTDPVARLSLLSPGSYGWSGAYGTHFWIDAGKNLVAVMMIQGPAGNLQTGFETAVMQAVMD